MMRIPPTPNIYGTCPPPIETLLLQWHKELADATSRLKPYNDLPYWYIERTNVGFVAQATNSLRLPELEEYSVDRGKGAKKRSGRGDLWFADSSGAEYIAEFKLVWPSIKSEPAIFFRTVNESVDEARTQVLDTEPPHGGSPHRLAMVFVIPGVAPTDISQWPSLMPHFLDMVSQPSMCGSEFSIAFEPPGDVPPTIEKRLYPAIALFGRVV